MMKRDATLTKHAMTAGSPPRRLIVLYAIFSAVGICVVLIPFLPEAYLTVAGKNDFTAFYVSAKLVGTPDLYQPAAAAREQARIHGGAFSPHLYNVRLPYYAAMLWPLGRLSFSVSYVIWQAIALAALLGFVRLWPVRRSVTVVVCCWFTPLAASFMHGQDITLLLLYLAATAALVRTGRAFRAGLILSLCAAKFHLFLFVPLLLVRRRMWRTLAGLVTAGVVLIVISFAVAGAQWPAEWWRATDPTIHSPTVSVSNAVYAAARAMVPGPIGPRIAVGALIAFLGTLVWKFGNSRPFYYTLAGAVAASVLIPGHIYAQDYTLVMPLFVCLLNDFLPGSAAAVSHSGERAAVPTQVQ